MKVEFRMKKILAIDGNCPKCGAPIDLSDIQVREVQCSHCGSSILLKNRPRPKAKKVIKSDTGESEVISPSYLSTGWAIASLILGISSIISVIFPIFCFSLNLAGLIAGIAGRHSSRKGLVVSGIVINSIGLILSVTSGIIFIIFGIFGSPQN
jgi:DNA-directed RNA polymerase subunit RPC12/RpoP